MTIPRFTSRILATGLKTDPTIVNIGGTDYFRFTAPLTTDVINYKLRIFDDIRARIVARYLWSGSPVDMLVYTTNIDKFGTDPVQDLEIHTFVDNGVMLKGNEIEICNIAIQYGGLFPYNWFDSGIEYLFTFSKLAPITGVDLYINFQIIPMLPNEIPMDRMSLIALSDYNDIIFYAAMVGIILPPSMSGTELVQYFTNEFAYFLLILGGDPIPDSILAEPWLLLGWLTFLHP